MTDTKSRPKYEASLKRASEWIDNQTEDFERMSRQEKVKYIKKKFYKDLPSYDISSQDFLNALEYIRGTDQYKEVTHKNGRITLRDVKGKIIRWLNKN